VTFLEYIENRLAAYPLKVFPEPDHAKAHELLQAGGMTLDAVSASASRWLLSSILAEREKWMAQSDNVAFAELQERVARLEEQMKELMEARHGREANLYGDQPNHTEDRNIRRGPGRPPGS